MRHRHIVVDMMRERLAKALGVFVATWLGGGLGYWFIGMHYGMSQSPLAVDGTVNPHNFGLLNCLYLSAMTVSTLGMVDLGIFNVLPPEGREFTLAYTIFYALSSYVVVVYATAQMVGYVVEGALSKYLEKRRMERDLASTKDHFVVVGLGATGIHVVEELVKMKHEVVGIDLNGPHAAVQRKAYPGEIFLEGDGTLDVTLERAGIARAVGLFAATPSDKDNIIITLTARQLSQTVRVVARASDAHNVSKLKSVGAHATISPSRIGGLRMASEMLRPATTTFLDTMLRSQQGNVRFDNVVVQANGRADGKTLAQVDLQGRTGLVVVALVRKSGEICYNPGGHEMVKAGDALVAIVSPESKLEAERHVNGP